MNGRQQRTPFRILVLRAAQAIGRPGAVRAVGQALARNRVPLSIPCHRVIASGGGLGGFSALGGVASKHRLLALKRSNPTS